MDSDAVPAAYLPDASGTPGASIQGFDSESNPRLTRKGDFWCKAEIFLRPDKPEKKPHAPAQVEISFQFAGKGCIHRGSEHEFFLRMKQNFEEGRGVEFVHHSPIEFHGIPNVALVTIQPPWARFSFGKQLNDGMSGQSARVHRQVNA